MFKSFSKFFSILTILFLFSLSVLNVFAEDPVPGLNKLYLTNIEVKSQNDKTITGTITLKNDSANYFPDLVCATELYRDGKPSSNFINIEMQRFELPKNSSTTLNFVHNIPIALPKGEYSIMARIYTRSGMPTVYKQAKLQTITNEIPFASFNYDVSHLLKDNKKEELNVGPTYNPGESPVLVATFKNLSSLQFSAKPHIEVFERNTSFNSTPVIKSDGESITFNANEEKTWNIKLPALSNPESYVASLYLMDSNQKRISDAIEVRYVVAGSSAKALNTVAYVDEPNKKIGIDSTFAGPADGSTLKEVTIKTTINQGEGKTPITKEQKIPLGSDPVKFHSDIPITEDIQNFSMSSEVVYEGKVLDNYKTNFDVSKILGKTPTPKPIQTTNNDSKNNDTNVSDTSVTNNNNSFTKKSFNIKLTLLIIVLIILIALAIYFKFFKKDRNY